MKAFVVSLSIILAIFLLTIINSVYVSHTAGLLIKEASNLEIDNGSVERFASLWEQKQFSIRITSSHEETHKIDEALAVLKAKSNEKDASGFCEERALLVEYLVQRREDEKVCLDSII